MSDPDDIAFPGPASHHSNAADCTDTDPFTWWRTRPPGSFTWADLDRLVATLTNIAPRGIPNWREAADGNPAACIAAAFACLPVGWLAPRRFDVAMAAVLRCALLGDAACAELLIHVLGRHGRRCANLRLVLLAGAWRCAGPRLVDANRAPTTKRVR